MTLTIHAVQTGSVQIKRAQRVRKPGGLVRVLTDSAWTEWLPIYVWVVDHPEGIIVIDTGETARASAPGYFPWWHPYYRGSVRMNVQPEEEIGPQLKQMGIAPQDVTTLILTHFHTDHAGGLHHFPASQILVSGADLQLAKGLTGRSLGYLPHRWPDWFDPIPIAFAQEPFGPFEQVYKVTQAGDVLIVPTPGHTPHHVSVIVRYDEVYYFLAGDTSYTQPLLQARQPDGVSPRADVTRGTMARILTFSNDRPTIYLPTHDPDSANRLAERRTLAAAPEPERG